MTLEKLLTGGSSATASVIWPMIIGVYIAIIIIFINKKTIGRLVKKLLSASADSEENAVSLKELGLEKKPSLRYALRPSSTLSNIIKRTEDERYYIPEDKSYRAESLYTQKRVTALTLIVPAILLTAAGIALLNALPGIISIISAVF